jgi:hypothetical protein
MVWHEQSFITMSLNSPPLLPPQSLSLPLPPSPLSAVPCCILIKQEQQPKDAQDRNSIAIDQCRYGPASRQLLRVTVTRNRPMKRSAAGCTNRPRYPSQSRSVSHGIPCALPASCEPPPAAARPRSSSRENDMDTSGLSIDRLSPPSAAGEVRAAGRLLRLAGPRGDAGRS